MKHIASASLLFFLSFGAAQPLFAAEDDAVRSRLEREKKAFRASVEKAKKDLVARLQAKIDAARKNGNREDLLRISNEKVELEVKGVLPKEVSTEEYREAVRSSLKTLDAAYDEAVRKYTKSGRDFNAGVLESERKAFSEEFSAIVGVGKGGPGKQDKKAAAPNGPGGDSPDPWGRWQKYPGNEGPRCIIWQDENGWHLRTLTAGRVRKFEGAIQVTGGKLLSISGMDGLEIRERKNRDTIRWNEEHDQISFTFLSAAGEDGFDFRLTKSASRLRCAIKLDTFDHPEAIFIGSQGRHPAEATFALEVRRPQAK